MSRKINDFDERIEFSESFDDGMWEYIYRKHFNHFKSMSETVIDMAKQKLGIDRIITLDSGKELLIDEKVREQSYPDIFLEYISNDRTKAPGWVEKKLHCDYIAYANITKRLCYMLPVPQLQGAWRDNKDEWLKLYPPPPPADNGTYRTHGCPVPPDVLLSAIYQHSIIDFDSAMPPRKSLKELLALAKAGKLTFKKSKGKTQ